ncbi:MAG TPA: hypothetical protein DHV63_02240 [Pseudomonas sp.]|nr:hypothetical protein [Pseudomonas sp.]
MPSTRYRLMAACAVRDGSIEEVGRRTIFARSRLRITEKHRRIVLSHRPRPSRPRTVTISKTRHPVDRKAAPLK